MSYRAKYLDLYANSEILALSPFPDYFQFEQCIVIPACNEKPDFIRRLADCSIAQNILLILVVNQSPSATEDVRNSNIFLAEFIRSRKILWQHQNLTLCEFEDLHILLVDRFSTGNEIPGKEGVGRARKIGCDLAVKLFSLGFLKASWIYSTDADAFLPENYFSHSSNETSAARVFNFEHVGEAGPLLDATLLYEGAIKYYRDALKWAGSPYAFYTLGSTLAVNIESYCAVRGFPPRAGGEDFYLLNKLVKFGKVDFIPDINIKLEARVSDRAPFGTGPAVQKVLIGQSEGCAFKYYNPEIFLELKGLLSHTHTLSKHLNVNSISDQNLSPLCIAALNNLNVERFFAHCQKQNLRGDAFLHHFHTWFDGFNTLKFVHFMQNSGYHALELETCISNFENLRRNHA